RFIGVRRHVDRSTNKDRRAREGFWYLRAIPASLDFPKSLRGDREGQHGITGLLGQQNGAHFCDIARAFRAIDGKRCGTAGAHQPHHLDDRAGRAATRGPTRGSVTESLDEPRDVFPVKTARRPHYNRPLLRESSRKKHTISP